MSDDPWQWAQHSRWNLPDTEWARTAVGLFSRIDTGPHNIYGEFVMSGLDADYLSDDELSSLLREKSAVPIEVSAHHAMMCCTNRIGPRFARSLVQALDDRIISEFEIRPTAALVVGDTDYMGDDPDSVERGWWGEVVQVVVDESGGDLPRVFFRRTLTEIIVWPFRANPEGES